MKRIASAAPLLLAAVAVLCTLCGAAAAKKPRGPRTTKAERGAVAPLPAVPVQRSTTAPRGAVDASVLAGTRTAAPVARPAPTGNARETVQRESHIEFDERLVQGQTAAGAIYLFQRGESEFRSMIRLPESFRERTTRALFHGVPTAQRQ